MQSVYPSGPSWFLWSHFRQMHLTEYSQLNTAANRNRLMYEWARHWNTSKPVLLEVGPLRFDACIFKIMHDQQRLMNTVID